MRVLFFSDCHGSAEALLALEKHIASLKPDKLILLGDCLNRGNNSFRDSCKPPEAAAILNRWQAKIIAVKGNCDSEEDQKNLLFPMLDEYRKLTYFGKKILINHGCCWNINSLPDARDVDILAYGHTHTPLLQRLPDGILILNPGSLDWPRSKSVASFAVMDEKKVEIRSLHPPAKILFETCL